MSIAHIYGIRVVAAVSLLSALAMTLFTTYVLITRVDDLKSSKFSASNVPENISSDPVKNTQYRKLLNDIDNLWIKYRSVLVSSSMLATLAGLLQGIFSGLVLLADLKSVRVYIRKWVTVHFILVFVLFIIILNTVVLTEHGEDKTSWAKYLQQLKDDLHTYQPQRDYSNLYRFLSVGPSMIYICVGANLGLILCLMMTLLVIMRRFQDYEAYE